MNTLHDIGECSIFFENRPAKEIAAIWKHGLVRLRHIQDGTQLRTSIAYLVKNMDEAKGDLFGRRGYLFSRNAEHNIVHKTWTPEGEAALAAMLDRIKQSRVVKTYEKSEPLGVAIQTADGEYTDILPGEELTDTLKALGFTEFKALYEYYNISLRCPEQFSIPTAAVRKQQPKK